MDVSLSALQHCFDRPLPGLEAQRRMAPAYRARPEQITVTGKDCKQAAVLIPLFPTSQGWATLLTLRRTTLSNHAGQISFPGGRQEPEESLQDTALREAREEVALPTAAIVSLHALSPLYIPPTNYCVYPFVALLKHKPSFQPNTAEVETLIPVLLEELLNPANQHASIWELHGKPVRVPFFQIGPYIIWGATAMILSELFTLLRPCLITRPTAPDAQAP